MQPLICPLYVAPPHTHTLPQQGPQPHLVATPPPRCTAAGLKVLLPCGGGCGVPPRLYCPGGGCCPCCCAGVLQHSRHSTRVSSEQRWAATNAVRPDVGTLYHE